MVQNENMRMNSWCLLITFANTSDPDQARQNVGVHLDSNCLTPTLMVLLKELYGK